MTEIHLAIVRRGPFSGQACLASSFGNPTAARNQAVALAHGDNLITANVEGCPENGEEEEL
jgi:hypothetical protein